MEFCRTEKQEKGENRCFKKKRIRNFLKCKRFSLLTDLEEGFEMPKVTHAANQDMCRRKERFEVVWCVYLGDCNDSAQIGYN